MKKCMWCVDKNERESIRVKRTKRTVERTFRTESWRKVMGGSSELRGQCVSFEIANQFSSSASRSIRNGRQTILHDPLQKKGTNNKPNPSPVLLDAPCARSAIWRGDPPRGDSSAHRGLGSQVCVARVLHHVRPSRFRSSSV